MQYDKGDILIYRVDNKPKGWGKFLEQDKNFVRLSLQGGDKIKVIAKDIVCNLGRDPDHGKVYGVEVDPEHNYAESKLFTEGVSTRYKSQTDWLEFINTKLRPQLKAKGCLRVLPCEVKVYRNHTSKHGSYHYRGKSPDTLKLFATGDAQSDLQCLFHEYGHGLSFRYFGPKRVWFWAKLYAASTHIDTISEDELTALRESLQAAPSFRDFVHDLEDDSKLVMKSVMRYLSQTHSLNRIHLDAAVKAGKTLEDYWPSTVDLVEREVVVTPYAKKNPEEYWAESFALYMMGIKLPKRVEQGVIDTLAGLRSSMNVEVTVGEQSTGGTDDE